jgi:hypothetical protein
MPTPVNNYERWIENHLKRNQNSKYTAKKLMTELKVPPRDRGSFESALISLTQDKKIMKQIESSLLGTSTSYKFDVATARETTMLSNRLQVAMARTRSTAYEGNASQTTGAEDPAPSYNRPPSYHSTSSNSSGRSR